MKGKETKHLKEFKKSKLKPNEEIQCFLEGWIGKMMGTGDDKQHNGKIIITNERICFYRKGLIGEVLETIPLKRITSIETLSHMGHRVLRVHTSHDSLEFKTFEDKKLFDEAFQILDGYRDDVLTSEIPSQPVSSESIPEQIKKIAELRDDGILSDDEFQSKKSDLLSKM